MNVRKLINEKILQSVKNVYGVSIVDGAVERPANESFGDFASAVSLSLSKELKQVPMEIAKNLCYELRDFNISFEWDGKKFDIFESIDVASPGFINFKLSQDWLKHLLFMEDGGISDYRVKESGKILVEFSQPNPNKPLHIGHSRNNFLGSSISNIYKFLGYDAVRVNYANDWGTHICKAMLMYKKSKREMEKSEKPDHFVGDLYSAYEQAEEKNPGIKNELAEMFRKLEAGDKETLEIWKKIVNWSYDGWKETYKNENVEFDIWYYQSNFKDSGKEIVKIALEKGLAEKDETGAIIARLEKYGIPDKVLLRSDGTSVYSTQDLQLAKDNFDKYNFVKRLYVVDYRQSDYFRQIFKVMSLLGFEWADRLFHLSYGTVSLPEGMMSSRKGLVVNSDEVFGKLVGLEKDEIEKSLKGVENVEETAKKVALAAFRYGMLKVAPSQNIIFRYEDVIKFEGNTGPYLMYTYARCRSILEKGGFTQREPDSYLLSYRCQKREEDILRLLSRFPEVVSKAAEGFLPNLIANFVFDLCQRFNAFYADVPVLSAKSDLEKTFRLMLVSMTSDYIRRSLNLLGIETVDRM